MRLGAPLMLAAPPCARAASWQRNRTAHKNGPVPPSDADKSDQRKPGPNRKLMPTVSIWTLLLPLVVKVSPTRATGTGAPTGTVNVRLFSPRKSYSTLNVQLFVKAHSRPPPTSHPLNVLLVEPVIDAPVDRSVRVTLSAPIQPPPPLT